MTTAIASRYRLERRLGIGGMSTVQLAFDERLERRVAVKLLAEHLAEDPAFVSRFRREALAAARLVHPNIVQVFDFGLDESSGQHYIVMEYVAGKSCAEILRDREVLGIDEGVDIIAQACRGLEHAHRNGVVHRDVKPGNLMVSNDGVVKLADFGIAKATEQSSITQVGSVLGTAAYLAPEQARGEEAGPPADIYALGVVTYQLLSGRLPYDASSLTELAMKQQHEAPLPLDAINPEVSPALAHAVDRALALELSGRYASAAEMGEALRAGERGIEPPPPAFDPDETAATRIVGAGAPLHDPTDATSVVAPRPSDAVVHRRRSGPPPPAVAEPVAAARPARAKRSGPARLLRALIILLILAGLIVVGAIVATDELSGKPRLRPVAGQDAREAIDQLRNLIDDNTR